MEKLKELYKAYCGAAPEGIVELQASGSHRRYYRMTGKACVMGVVGTSEAENRAFITLDRHFASKGINVPAVLSVSEDGMRYLQEDLGDTLLFDAISTGRENGHYSASERALLCKVISCLPDIQYALSDGFDWSVCYPEAAFDGRMVSFDLNYFKYCFLKATGLEFDEIPLQDDFDRLQHDLMSDMGQTFMYRDFQARNVMIKDGEPYFIDFQGGRRGPVQYDLASFVWQARSRYPDDLRAELEAAYLESLRKYVPSLDEAAFRRKYRLFVLFRTLQVLGAYGFRGYFEKKPHFLGSVPFAIDNLRKLLREPFEDYPYLSGVLTSLTKMHQFYEIAQDKRLEVSIFSFSYKKGIPADTSGNGGGYVFDCRSINNPGKFEYYRQFNGNDPEVIKFLEDDGEILRFLEHVYALVDPHVQRFIERKFTHLQVCFGCTGGQHRSVYAAEHLAAHLAGRFDVKIVLRHRELDQEKLL
ncbi:MAG: phosphotransferase [Bacteroidales bacterium]|nr:phosphotransferase [Bacteroidales bacterium]MBR6246633.1 phosphotransferase [Bacteroidales bacterium]